MGMVGWAIAAYVVGAWLAGVPFTLLHELGHALAALALGVRRVIVTVGHPPAWALELGRLELRIRLFNRPRWAWFGTIESPNDDELSRGRAIAFLAAGPAASTAALIGLLVAAALVPWPPVLLVWVTAVAVAWQLLVTAIPMRYPNWFGPYAGRVSDGYRIARLMR
jgi:hypothetical protein